MVFKIEPASEYDASEIAALIQTYFSYTNIDFDAQLRRMKYPWLYFERSMENGVFTGFAEWEILSKKKGLVRLNGMAIKPNHRRKGHASVLIKGGEKWAKQKGMKKIMLLVAESNEAAKKLYEKNGYTKAGINPKKIEGKVSEIWEKNLD